MRIKGLLNGNGLIQHSEPWKYMKLEGSPEKSKSLSTLAFCWQICRGLAITLRPFLPFQSDELWAMLGEDTRYLILKKYVMIF